MVLLVDRGRLLPAACRRKQLEDAVQQEMRVILKYYRRLGS